MYIPFCTGYVRRRTIVPDHGGWNEEKFLERCAVMASYLEEKYHSIGSSIDVAAVLPHDAVRGVPLT